MIPLRVLLTGVALLSLTGCVGQVIETTTDAAIAVAKVPFKVGGAVIDVATGDEDDEDDKSDDK
ncbi:MAG: NF038104 family lipoprotein [Gammaproteobacteria bacterium]